MPYFYKIFPVILIFFGFFSTLVFFVPYTFAQTCEDPGGLVPCGRLCDDPDTPRDETAACQICDIFELTDRIWKFLLTVLVPGIAIILFIIAGILILLYGANPSLQATGKNIFKTTVWGLIIIFGAWMITNTVMRSLAGDSIDRDKPWYVIECVNPVVSTTQPPTTQPPSDSVACLFQGVNYATFNICSGLNRPGGCGEKTSSQCSRYLPAINRYANGAATANILKTFMVIESDCNPTRVSFDGSSFGLMQFKPATANQFKSRCGITENITSSWLTNPANADKSICLAAAFINSIAAGDCGSSPGGIYAGYSAGAGWCGKSNDCQGEQSCSGGPMKAWECPYDTDKVSGQKVCNTGLYQTKQGAAYTNYCINNLGF